jgi:putative PIN family toxin of toxin-antitoxin system
MIYVVIDTNVLVSALLSKHPDSSTVVIRKHILDGSIIPLYNDEIYTEYANVLHRPKFQLPTEQTDAILDAIVEKGIMLDRTKTNESFPDPNDVVFYEIALSKEGSFLVTGNIKHFPNNPIVVTPAELIEIIEKNKG